jgi:hypothetical protein
MCIYVLYIKFIIIFHHVDKVPYSGALEPISVLIRTAGLLHKCEFTEAHSEMVGQEQLFCLYSTLQEQLFCMHSMLHKQLFCLHSTLQEQLFCLHSTLQEQLFCMHSMLHEQLFCLYSTLQEQLFCLYSTLQEQLFCMHSMLHEQLFCLYSTFPSSPLKQKFHVKESVSLCVHVIKIKKRLKEFSEISVFTVRITKDDYVHSVGKC